MFMVCGSSLLPLHVAMQESFFYLISFNNNDIIITLTISNAPRNIRQSLQGRGRRIQFVSCYTDFPRTVCN